MTRAKANGIEIEYETTGAKSNPAILLIMGLGAQLTLWSDAFCEGLAAKGFYVVRFDNRDCGLSTDFDSWGQANLPAAIMKLMTGKKIEAPYLVGDMAADAVGLVEALGLERAHMIGASMGGMIAQVAAAKYPARTRSLVSIMSTSSRPGLPQGKPEAIKATLERPATSDRETMVRHYMMLRRTIGSPAYPESDAEMRRLVETQHRPPLLSRGRRPAVSRHPRLGRSRRTLENGEGADPGDPWRRRSAAAAGGRPRRRRAGARRPTRNLSRNGPRPADGADAQTGRSYRHLLQGGVRSST